MAVPKCMYVVWTPHSIRHFPIDYDQQYFDTFIVPACEKFLESIKPNGTCSNMLNIEKHEAFNNLYKHFPECDPRLIDRPRSFLSEEEQVNLMQVNDLH